jgi:diguanylate cyclase (GGDEF)-like protein
MGWVKERWLTLVDAGEAETPAGRALLQQRYAALQRQIPLLYTVALTNVLGLAVATGGRSATFFKASAVLVILVLVRLAYWLRARNRTLPPQAILRELQKTWVYALVISVGFCAYALSLLDNVGPQDHVYVILFGSLAAVGCAYGISSYGGAARLPLLLLGYPLAARLVFYGDAAHLGMGVSIAMVMLIILRLLTNHNRGFRRLVEAQVETEAERARARRAERAAKVEKARATIVADTDSLTGLANRRAFLRELGTRASAVSRKGVAFAVAFIDLDGFKPINDTFGHAAGDAVLQQVGERLVQSAGPGALVARTGGDEFALALPDIGDHGAAEAAGAVACAALQAPFVVEGREFRISGCCGLTILRRGDCKVEEALIRADTALYRAKSNGRAGVAVFTTEMGDMHRRRSLIEQALRESDTQDMITLVYQPVRDLTTGELRAFEALARWDHPQLGRVPPDQFVPLAEQINVIGDLSDRLLAKAAREARNWADSVRLSFNVSAIELCTARSSRRILAVAAAQGLAPERLQIELTETALLVDFEVARTNLRELREAGVRIVLDDFGAGHASISYLREMPFDGVKIDGSLVDPIAYSQRAQRLLKGVLDLCASLGMPCVGEQIETEEQADLLRTLGCRDGQGFHLSPPLHAAAAAALASPKVVPLTRRIAAA